jgi:glucosylceramidase
MLRCKSIVVIIMCYAPFYSTLWAADVSWRCSTIGSPWLDKGTVQTVAWDNDGSIYIVVDEKTTCQEIDGWGACFNELPWEAICKLPQADRDSVMCALFDTMTGLKFDYCRVPIGMSDYAVTPYTNADTPGDYAMEHFSIDRDRLRLIPFIKAAMAFQPGLRIWGSPFTPPPWMKTMNTYWGGRLKADTLIRNAYALYLEKFVRAYRDEGIRFCALHLQNMPDIVGSNWLRCEWTPDAFRDVIKLYLAPKFKQDDVPVEIWCGIIGPHDNPPEFISTVMHDTVANSFCTGVSNCYSAGNTKYVSDSFLNKRILLSETPSGYGSNDWPYAEEVWRYILPYFQNGATGVMQWNMADAKNGTSNEGKPMCALITVDTAEKTFTRTPQYYLIKHFSFYVKPGAYRITTTGDFSDQIAFRNPDGQNILIVANISDSSATVAINVNGQKIKPALPAHSFNTFCVAGTPIPTVSPYGQIEAEKYSSQSGTYAVQCGEGGSCLSYIHNNDWSVYNNLDFGSGANGFQARVAGTKGGSIEVRPDSVTAALAGICTVESTGEATTWKTVSCSLNSMIRGKHTLYLKFKGANTGNDAADKLFDLNWWQFITPTGVKAEAETYSARVNLIDVSTGAGKTLTVRLGLSKQYIQGNLKISLFDLNGRQLATLFNGRSSSSHLMLRLDRTEIGPGVHVIKVSLDGTIALIKTGLFR